MRTYAPTRACMRPRGNVPADAAMPQSARPDAISRICVPASLPAATHQPRNTRARAWVLQTHPKKIKRKRLGIRCEPGCRSPRAEDWPRRTIPEGCLLLTCGIDVQHNRWAVRIEGWGRNDQSWCIDYVEIPGDPTREEDWADLDAIVFAPITNHFGVELRPCMIAVDSGNWTHEVYRWVRKHPSRNVIAIKGSNQPNKPVINRPTAQDVNVRGQSMRHGVQLWNVGVNTAKDTLFARLTGDAGVDAAERRCHFPADMTPDFYEQHGAERYDMARKRWVKRPGARNEAWDCWVYAYAAACHPLVRVYAKREADWAALETKIEPRVVDIFDGRSDSKHPSIKTPTTEPSRRDSPGFAPSDPSRAWRNRL